MFNLLRVLIVPIAFAASIPSLKAEAQTTITTVTPPQGPISGGTQVTLAGSGFAGTTLTLDGAVISPSSASDTQIVFQTPPRDNGIASIKISGRGPNAYAEFLYLPPPLESLPPGYITTVMGIGVFRGDGRLGTSAMVDTDEPGLALSRDGSLFICEPNESDIRRLRPDGVIERYAGSPTPFTGVLGDGSPALTAHFAHPRGIAIDPAGNLLVSDNIFTNSIRRIDAGTGIISTIYGGQSAGFSGDGGPAVNAQFHSPIQITFDGLGNLYVLDWGNVRIRRIDPQGIITSIAGNGTVGLSGDGGPATQATFNVGTEDEGGLAADSQGNVYLADKANNRARRIDGRTGIITTFSAPGPPVESVLTDSNDNVYVGLHIGNRAAPTMPSIFKLSPAGNLIRSWGNGWGLSNDHVVAATAPLCGVTRMALDASGNILFAEECSHRIRRINVTTGLLDTVAGMGPHIIGESGSALATVMGDPGADLLFLPSGDLLVAEHGNYRIRKMDQRGNLSNFAGSGLAADEQEDVPALQAFMDPNAISRAPNGDIFVAIGEGILRIDSSGLVHVVTSFGSAGPLGDGGPAVSASTDEPWDVANDLAGNLFIADSNNNRIRRIDARTGIITTVAGSGPGNGYENYGAGSYCGDGGPATQACLNTPYGVAIAPDGTMYIGELSARVRKVTPQGIITTFFDGAGQRLRLSDGGNLFTTPYRIQPNGHAYRFAFTSPAQSGLGDGGPASTARSAGGFFQDAGIAVDHEGNLFLVDASNSPIVRVRAIRYGAVMSEPGSSVIASSESPQSTSAGTMFPSPLQITLRSPEGTLENGIRVDFAAPTSGATCTFPGGGSTFSTLTDINGRAGASCTANAQTGSYSVTATPLSLSQSASFLLTNTPAAANTPGPLSGLWWNANESGWGIDFTQRGVNIFAAWYTYDAAGNPKWYVSTCGMAGGSTGSTGTCSGTLYEVNGPTFFGTPFDPSRVNAVQAGNLRVTFQGTDSGSMTYTGVAGQTRTVAITRQPLSAGAAPPVNYTDIWWNPNESGWGMAITQQSSTMFLAWYVYDGTGKPMWYVATCDLNGTTCSGSLLRTTGPAFGPTFNPSLVQVLTAGTVSVTFVDGNNATLSYTVNGASASKVITRQVF